MSNGAMILNVELSNDGFAQLSGQNVELWSGFDVPSYYSGPIENAPIEIINELSALGAIKMAGE